MKHFIYLLLLLLNIQITNAQKNSQKTLKDSENFIVLGDFGRFGEYNQKDPQFFHTYKTF